MKEIETRDDIEKLVHQFYAKIRKHKTLGPIFDMHLSEEQWPDHLDKLTDFWETNLLGIPKFKGNPPQAHADVDRNLDYTFKQEFFSEWITLWFQTIDELYVGRLADRAKNAARRMSTGLYLALWYRRPGNQLL